MPSMTTLDAGKNGLTVDNPPDDEWDSSIEAALKKAYARIVMPDEDGSYRGEVLEFSGCIAVGDTPSETLENLEDAAKEWLRSAMTLNQNIPNPVDAAGFSGKLVLRIPKSLHRKSVRYAERDGVSLNQFITTALAEHVGERRSADGQTTFMRTVQVLHSSLVGQEIKFTKTSGSLDRTYGEIPMPSHLESVKLRMTHG